MELKKIDYKSAVYFAPMALLLYLISGALQVFLIIQNPTYQVMVGPVSKVQLLVYTPLVGAMISYLFVVFAIFVYNLVAKKYPFTWEVKK